MGYLIIQNYMCLFYALADASIASKLCMSIKLLTLLWYLRLSFPYRAIPIKLFKMGFSMFHWFNFCSNILPSFFLKSQSSKLKAFAYVQYTCIAWIEGLRCLKTLFRVSIYCIYWPWCWPFKWPVCNCWLLALNAAVAHESLHLVGNYSNMQCLDASSLWKKRSTWYRHSYFTHVNVAMVTQWIMFANMKWPCIPSL